MPANRDASRAKTMETLEPRLLLSASVTEDLPDRVLRPGGTQVSFDLDGFFDDTSVDGTVVEFDSVLGDFKIELLDSITPNTVANFLRYVDANRYDDVFAHRSVASFVVQMGGYGFDTDYFEVNDFGPVDNEFDNFAVATGSNVAIENGSNVLQFTPGTDLAGVNVGDRIRMQGGNIPGIFFQSVVSVNQAASTVTLDAFAGARFFGFDVFITPDTNTRGTLAMAKLSGDPDSATSEFFFNLANNASNLDTQNGGFTVFGQVIGNGMTIIDSIASLFTGDLRTVLAAEPGSSAFSDLPLINYTQGDLNNSTRPDADNLVLFNSVHRSSELNYDVTGNSNPGLVNVAVDDQGNLTLTPQGNGTGLASVTVRATDASGNSVQQNFQVTVVAATPKADFNQDGQADLVFRNYQTGQNAAWLFNGTTRTNAEFLRRLNNTDFVLAGLADFDGDGDTDLLWRNTVTGQNALWIMNGTSFVRSVNLPRVRSTSLEIGAVGDFNGDGHTDIAWRNVNSGQNVIWTFEGTSRTGTTALSLRGNRVWRMTGAGDFNQDGTDDLVFRRTTDGLVSTTLIRDNAPNGNRNLRTVNNSDLQIGAVEDINGDGNVDLIFRNDSNGTNIAQLYNGTTFVSAARLRRLANTDWRLPGQQTLSINPLNVPAPAAFEIAEDDER